MKSNSDFAKKVVLGIALLGVIGLLGLATARAEQPLSKDDVTLLLLGAPSDKIIQTVQERGIDFQMNPDLAKKFHDLGASDDLIAVLQKAGNKPPVTAPSASSADRKPNAPGAPTEAAKPSTPIAPGAAASKPAPEGKPNVPSASVASAPPISSAESSSEPTLHVRNSTAQSQPQAPAAPAQASAPATSPAESSSEPTLRVRDSAAQSQPQAPAAATQASAPAASPAESSSEPTLHVRNSAAQSQPQAPAAATQAGPAAPANPATASAPALKDPNPEEIQRIIREFAAKEKVFREARNNYTYHQVNKVQELGPDNEVVGTYQQEWDILYDDSGKRIERVTYAPTPSLKGLIVTKEDIENFRNIQPFVLTTEDLPDYEIKYLGHVKVDQIVAYVFSLRPKEIQKNRLYFQGVVWVDDRDLQIVKSEGKTVPELKGSKGQNLFPRFTTWREQIDGKFWFPTFTLADDTLYFPNGPPIHMKEIVRYSDYKQFKSGVRIVTVESVDKQKESATPPPAAPQK
jgi:chemotaxis protein histidine kinase CheA